MTGTRLALDRMPGRHYITCDDGNTQFLRFYLDQDRRSSHVLFNKKGTEIQLSKCLMSKSKTYLSILMGFLILLVLVEMLFLIIQNKKLKEQIIALRNEIPDLIINDYAPTMEVIKLDGELLFMDFIEIHSKSLLFILPKSCATCEKNLLFLKRFSSQLKDRVQVLAIVLGRTDRAQDLKNNLKMDFPIYIPENENRFSYNYRISNFSLTFLINERGRIQWIKKGDLNSDDYFKIKDLVINQIKEVKK